MFSLPMVQGFADELIKISAVISEQQPVISQSSEMVTTSLKDPLNSWSKTPDWKKESPQSKKEPPKSGKVKDESLPAKNANKLFFRPSEGEGDTVDSGRTTKFKTLPNDSAARQMNRDGSPIDAQSTANVASANMISPASGPGGV